LRVVVVLRLRLLLAAGFFAAAVRPRAAVVRADVVALVRVVFAREAAVALFRAGLALFRAGAVVVFFRAGAALLFADDAVDLAVVFFAVVRAFAVPVVFLVVLRFTAMG